MSSKASPTPPGSRAFIHRQELRFGDCDPAGLVYFPRFFDFFHQAMESWFGEELGKPYDQVILQEKIGFPAVHTEADFRQPSRFGEILEVELRVLRVGKSSIDLEYRVKARGESELRVQGKTTVVCMDLDEAHEGFRSSMALPEFLRAAIQAFMGDSER